MTDQQAVLAAAAPDDVGAVRLDAQGQLVIPSLSAEDVPCEATMLRQEWAEMLSLAPGSWRASPTPADTRGPSRPSSSAKS